MTDIVERLRMDADIRDDYCLTNDDILEAADEIERSRSDNATLRTALQNHGEEAARMVADIAELVGALEWADTWIYAAPHDDDCYVSDHYEGDPGAQCNCGKESLHEAICAVIFKHTTKEEQK